MNLLIQEALERLEATRIQIEAEAILEVAIILLMYILVQIEEVNLQGLILLLQGGIQQ